MKLPLWIVPAFAIVTGGLGLSGASAFADQNVRVALGRNQVWFNWGAQSAPRIDQLRRRGDETLGLAGCQFQDGTCLRNFEINDQRPHCTIHFYDQNVGDIRRPENFLTEPKVISDGRGRARILHSYILTFRGESVAFLSCSGLESLGLSPSNRELRDMANRAFGGFMFFY